MPNFISYCSHEISAKGISQAATPQPEKIQKYLFDEEYAALQKIKALPLMLPTKRPTLFYPGCGSDVLMPLLILEKMFPIDLEINCLFVDSKDNLPLVQTILDDVGISFSEKQDTIRFYWNSLFINFSFTQKNVFAMELPTFDIYFERAFRIMKDADPKYEARIYSQLSENGLLLSDSGFSSFPLKQIPFPAELSSYGEMAAGIKRSPAIPCNKSSKTP